MSNVYGKHVLVTGASRGIGKAVAEALATAGCSVTAVSRGCSEATKDFPGGGSIHTVPMDVTNQNSVSRVVGSLDRIDIAVLCAGMGVAGSAEELPMELARSQTETNYFGVLNVGGKDGRYVWENGDYRFEEGRFGVKETYELRVLDFVGLLKARGVE